MSVANTANSSSCIGSGPDRDQLAFFQLPGKQDLKSKDPPLLVQEPACFLSTSTPHAVNCLRHIDATEDNTCVITRREDKCSSPRSYSEEQLNQAIFDVMKNKMKASHASKQYGIPMKTLYQGLHQKGYTPRGRPRKDCTIVKECLKLNRTAVSCTDKDHCIPEDDLHSRFCDGGVDQQKPVEGQPKESSLVSLKLEKTALHDGTALSGQLHSSSCSKISSAAMGSPLCSQNTWHSASVSQDNLLSRVPVVICTRLEDFTFCVPPSVKYSSEEAKLTVTEGTEEQFTGAKGESSTLFFQTRSKKVRNWQ